MVLINKDFLKSNSDFHNDKLTYLLFSQFIKEEIDKGVNPIRVTEDISELFFTYFKHISMWKVFQITDKALGILKDKYNYEICREIIYTPENVLEIKIVDPV